MSAFVKLKITEETRWLMERHPTAFLLLAQSAVRVKWADCPITGLKAGQALIGDFKTAGIDTKAAYRAAKKRLESLTLATFRGTPRGTVATLTSSRIFETLGNPSNTQDDTTAARKQHASSTQSDAGAAPNIDIEKESERDSDLLWGESADEQRCDSEPGSPLPKGWRKMKPAERQRKRVSFNTPLMIKVGELMGRRKTTLWNIEEAVALDEVGPQEDEIAELEPFYSAVFPEDQDFRRKNVITLLNNWNGELDKARGWAASQPTTQAP